MQEQVRRTAEVLLQKANSLPDGERLLVGIAGRPGGGKTTFCTSLLRQLECLLPKQIAFVPMDGFHYTRAQLDAFSDPADAHYRRGAVDTFDANAWCALVKRLRRMDKGEVVSVPGFDHAVKDPEEGKLKVRGDCKIILLEGNYILLRREPWASAAREFDERILVDTPREETITRLAKRNHEAGIAPTYVETLARVLAVDVLNGDLLMSESMEPTIHIRTSNDPAYVDEAEKAQKDDEAATQIVENDA
ncbi:hypothetical protein NCC49_002378 [Naganishia albida]|nr:hypothetical protein NCC49_002378 [Naganishia albida]